VTLNPEEAAPSSICKNCGAAVGAAFCARCGQSATVRRLDVGTLLTQVVDALVDWDGRLWGTLRGLSTRPGRVCAEYVDGRRQSYVPPLRYCLLALLANLLVGPIIVADTASYFPISSSQPQQEALRSLFIELRRLAVAHSDWVALFGVPFLAIQFRLLMGSRKRNLAECGAFVLYITGHVGVMAILMSPLKWLGVWPAVFARVAIVFSWYCVATREFFSVGWMRATWAALLALFTTFAVSALALLIIAWLRGELPSALGQA
jgi:hypothetical protein